MLALTVALDNVIQGAVVGAAGGRLEAFLKIFGKDRGAMREVIAKIATLGAQLLDGVDGRNAQHADGEGENQFESSTHKFFAYETRTPDHAVSTSGESDRTSSM
jgi:hypothetical protein